MNAIHDVIFTVLAISVPEFMLFISVDLLEPFINKYVLHFHTEIKFYDENEYFGLSFWILEELLTK